MIAPKARLEVVRSSVHDADIWHVYGRGGALVGVLGHAAVDGGNGHEWRVLWRRGKGDRGWVRGGDERFPDRERAAEMAFLGFVIGDEA